MTQPCPTQEQLRRLLADQLSGPGAHVTEAHVQECPACQDTLQRLTTGAFFVGQPAPPPAPSGAAFLGRLEKDFPRGPDPEATAEPAVPPRCQGPTTEPGEGARSTADKAVLLDMPIWPEGHTFLDDFTVEGALGQGGMGTVYRVRQLSTGRHLAVKRVRPIRPDSRRLFLVELQLWADLPEHPNLAPYRFFRTVNDEVVIFTDLAAGGALAQAISQGGLLALEDRLDVAIQVARGLHALHERGLVHQDVKPANVLLDDGVARVCDFGLARARARLTHTDCPPSDQSVLLTSGGMTPAYCSPEQAAGMPVSRRTDVWSWGVLVLELFAGRVPVCDRGGPFAADALERFLAEGLPSGGLMPSGLVGLLRRCFAPDPEDRWPGLGGVIDELSRLFEASVGRPYHRKAPPVGGPAGELVPVFREQDQPAGWGPPREWLGLAFRLEGRDPTEAGALIAPLALTRRARAVGDLAAYEEARQRLERLVAAGRLDVRAHLAALFTQKAAVHLAVRDFPGCLEAHDRALGLWREMILRERRHELTPNLFRACIHKAAALRRACDAEAAIALCDEVLARWQKLTNRRARQDLRENVASASLNKGLCLRALGQDRAASRLYAQAIELYEQLGGREPAAGLAQACLCQAGVLSALGEHGRAAELCDRAIQFRARLARDGRASARADLGRAYAHKAAVLRAQEKPGAAVTLYDQTIVLFGRLVEQEGRDDLSHDLAQACLARAAADRSLGRPTDAIPRVARAAAIWEHLVHDEGQGEHATDLARACRHMANTLRAAGRAGDGLAWSERAVSLLERLVNGEGRAELGNDLARAWIARANLLRALGRSPPARELYERARRLRLGLLAATGREDVQGDFARDRVGWAELLAELGEHDASRQELAEAVPQLEALVKCTDRFDLRNALARARRLLGLRSP